MREGIILELGDNEQETYMRGQIVNYLTRKENNLEDTLGRKKKK